MTIRRRQMPGGIKGSFGKKEAAPFPLVCRDTCMGQGHVEELELPGRSGATNHKVSADTCSYFCLQTACCLTAHGNNFSHVDCFSAYF